MFHIVSLPQCQLNIWTKSSSWIACSRICWYNSTVCIPEIWPNITYRQMWLRLPSGLPWGFRTCWKWVQVILTLSTPREEHKIHKLGKWLALKPSTLSIGQLQDYAFGVMPRTDKPLPKFHCFKCKVSFCIVLCCRIYHAELNFWIRLPWHCGKENISDKFWTFDYNNIFLYLRSM